ncbi:unnamed protein product [Fusarium graminearum]|nr:unnamed protein product [Fusarium graminearum]
MCVEYLTITHCPRCWEQYYHYKTTSVRGNTPPDGVYGECSGGIDGITKNEIGSACGKCILKREAFERSARLAAIRLHKVEDKKAQEDNK